MNKQRKVSRSVIFWLRLCHSDVYYTHFPPFSFIHLCSWSYQHSMGTQLHLPGDEAVCFSTGEQRCFPSFTLGSVARKAPIFHLEMVHLGYQQTHCDSLGSSAKMPSLNLVSFQELQKFRQKGCEWLNDILQE